MIVEIIVGRGINLGGEIGMLRVDDSKNENGG